ncbi:MAG: helix-turn-helix transcriptional regulator [Chlorogloeopsis fritschii C42_A2020_084]|jgi:AraC family transcriptional regulator|nr:AraC family transcriptional regulator [Chlorogloeopsis fritschii]MBF2005813.1 helix-turn-helix transcriptional regulator [Chlorogloeopsis fritschii C42_A2020_084]
MTGQQPVPKKTSTLAFEEYTSSSPVLSSVHADWQNLLLRTYIEPASLDYLLVPAVPDPYIVLQVAGTTTVSLREEGESWSTVQVHPGELFFTTGGGNPYEVRWRSESDELIETVHLHLNHQFLARTGEQVAEINPSRIELLERSGIRDPFVEQICSMLKQELEQQEIGSKLYADSAAQLLAVHLLRHHCTIEHQVKEYQGGLPQNRLCRVTDYIQAHLETTISLDDLAQQAGMSSYHFARLFKQSTGESPNQYVVRLRIETAQRLLRETNLGVLDVALSVGYNSPSHLATQFKRLVGVTPSAYRHSH